jgi:hypothetical protein
MAYYPANVLGLPDTVGRDDVATTDPMQILALGLGGEITLRFDHRPITDGPGPDFTVFENAFRYHLGTRDGVYAEPAQVSVSRDGIIFRAFPIDSLTLAGCAGRMPTHGDRDPGDPAVSGGDQFDLAELGLDSIRYVRLHDVTQIITANRDHPFWDPTLNGFDLDAVVALPHQPAGVPDPDLTLISAATLAPNPIAGPGVLRVRLARAGLLRGWLTDMAGRNHAVLVDREVPAGELRIPVDVSGLAAGVYLMTVELDGRRNTTFGVVVE